MVRERRAGLAVAAGLALLLATPAAADERLPPSSDTREQGPFTQRNLFPFNLLFLSFPARQGSILPGGHRELLVLAAYVNTFTGSDAFMALDTGQRKLLTPADVSTAQAEEPGESLFFMDTEQARTSMIYRAGLGHRLEWSLEVPFLSYLGGRFDSAIEGYHRAAHLGNSSREYYFRDAVQIALTLEGKEFFADSSPAYLRLGDLAVSGRIALADSPRAAVAISVSAKLPTGDADSLCGSGSLDTGVEAEGTLRWGRQRLHLAAGWVHPGRWDLFPEFNPRDIANFGIAYEYAHSARLSWIGQLQTQSSVFRGWSGANGSLADYSTEILAGARWQGREGRWSFQTAFIENIFDQNNSVDVGMLASFGIRFSPSLISRSSAPEAATPLR